LSVYKLFILLLVFCGYFSWIGDKDDKHATHNEQVYLWPCHYFLKLFNQLAIIDMCLLLSFDSVEGHLSELLRS
jgi:hypothetical protein